MRRSLTLRLLCLATFASALHAQKITSGFYGDHTLQLVAAPDGSFTASFYDETGAGRFTCGFLLHSDGKPSAQGIYKVVTWWPDKELNGGDDDQVIAGTVTASATGLTLQLPKQAHGGCWNVNGELDQGEPVDLHRDTDHNFDQNHTQDPAPTSWQSLRVVKADRVPIRPRPDKALNTRPYIVSGDVVIVTATQGSWVHVLYYSFTTAKSFTGWLQDSDLLPNRIP